MELQTDVIRVGDTYYMLKATAYYLPGGAVYRSSDGVHWEFVSYVFERLGSRPEECLEGELNIYGKGMRTAELSHADGKFYAAFEDGTTGQECVFAAESAEGPWEKMEAAESAEGPWQRVEMTGGAEGTCQRVEATESARESSRKSAAATTEEPSQKKTAESSARPSTEKQETDSAITTQQIFAPSASSELFTGNMKGSKPEFVPVWQWNHEPNDRLWRKTEDGGLAIKTGKISLNLLQAVNTLTQPIVTPSSTFEVSIDMTGLGSGDFSGIAILQGAYAWIGVTKEIGRYFIVMQNRMGREEDNTLSAADFMPGNILTKFPYDANLVRLRITTTVTEKEEIAEFYYRNGGVWEKLGTQNLYYSKDRIIGCRFAMFLYSTIKTGGEAVFYHVEYAHSKD